MGIYEDDTKHDVENMLFKNTTFSPNEVHEFAEEHGYPTALLLMQECLDKNTKLHKAHKPLVGLMMGFRGRTVKYKAGKRDDIKRENKRNEMEAFRSASFAAHENGFEATPEDITSELVEFHTNGYDDGEGNKVKPSDEDYNRGLRFLVSLKNWKEAQPKTT